MSIGSVSPKTVFITNRGGTHPNRLLYFDSINADYQYVDFKLRWHGLNRSKIIMILSGLLCAFTFPKREKYELFVTSDPQLPAALMKRLGLLRSDQKIASYLGSQTLYFMHSGYYSRFTIKFYQFLLRSYDFHICNGQLQAQFLEEVAGIDPSKIHVNFNGVSVEKSNRLNAVSFNPESETILFIGNIYSNWRIHYKGLDVTLQAFAELLKIKKSFKFVIVGDHDDSLISLLSKTIPEEFRANIELKGKLDDITSLFNDCCFYVHCSRGDALPNSLIEALYAGIPSIVSNITGNYEIVADIDSRLVTNVNAKELLDAMSYYLNLPIETKIRYSEIAKNKTKHLSQAHAVDRFNHIIEKIGTP